MLGQVGDQETALRHLDEALERNRELGDSMRVAMTLANLGTLAVVRDRPGRNLSEEQAIALALEPSAR